MAMRMDRKTFDMLLWIGLICWGFCGQKALGVESEKSLIHTSYPAYRFEAAEQWGLAGSGNIGNAKWDQKKWHLDFSENAAWLALRIPDFVLLGQVEKIHVRARGSAKGHPVHLFLRTHFMTFHKVIGEFAGTGEQDLVTDGPPGSGWQWFGGENDGKIHGPLRLAEIRVEGNGIQDHCDLEMIGISVDTACPPQKRCVLTASVKSVAEKPCFSAQIRALDDSPLSGKLVWTFRMWDGNVLDRGEKKITVPPKAKLLEVLTPVPQAPAGMKFIESEFALDIPEQEAPPALACWLAPHEPHGDARLEPDSPFGMGLYLCRYGGDAAGLAEMEKAAQLARDAGVKWSREDFSWSRIEPQKGKFNWTYHDNLVACAKRNGITVYGIVGSWASWTKPYSPEGIEEYAAFLKELVRHYGDDVRQWEIWNEPNIFFWQGPKEMYADLLIQSYAAIKEVDPDTEVLGLSTAGIDYKYIRQMLEKETPFDILTIHPYRKVLKDREFIEDLKKVSDLVKYSDEERRPVWLTEMGWSTNSPHNVLSQDFTPVTLRTQAELIARSYLCSIVSGVEPRTFWYDFRDDGYDPIYFEHCIGIMTRDFRPKPAYYAYSTLAKVLKGKPVWYPIETKSDTFAYGFKSEESGGEVIALWNSDREVKLSWPISVERVTCVNTVGESKVLIAQKGKIELELKKGAPLYLLLP